jgi:sortase A
VRGYYELPDDHTARFPALPEAQRRLRLFPFPRRTKQAGGPPPVQRNRRAKVMRVLPFVLLGIGVLLLAEGAITVLWKEPFSALLTASGQQALGDDLKKMEAQAAAQAAESRKQMIAYQQRAAVKLNRNAKPGQAIGRLRIPKTGLNMVVVQSTDEESLKKGPAHYSETPLPGKKGHWTVGIAGHRTTYEAPFRHNDSLKRGNKIYFTLPYGRFTYSVMKVKIVDAGYTKAFVPQGKDLLVLTACHPLYSAAQRILVYAKLIDREPLGGAKRAAVRPPAKRPPRR